MLRYAAYRDSGVEWLGDVPAHWEVRRLKAVSTHNDDILDETTLAEQQIEYVDISSVDTSRGIISSETFACADAPSRARRRVRHGDVIVSTVRTYLRAIARIVHPPENLVVSTGFAVLRAGAHTCPGFLAYSLLTDRLVEQIIARSTGVSFPAITASELVTLPIPFPSLGEQRSITDFLDEETSRLDALVAEHRRLIDLLKEKRRAIIAHAIARGLDPAAPTRPSGVEWLGEVPAHWLVSTCRAIVTNRSNKNTSGRLQRYLSLVANIGVMPYEEKGDIGNKKPQDLRRCKIVEPGDLVINSMNYGIGSYGVSPYQGLCSPVYLVLTPSEEAIVPRYAYRIFESCCFQSHAQSLGNGILEHRCAITWDSLGGVGVPVPPRAEQRAIVDFIDKQTAHIDALVSEARRAIGLLSERRSAIISAATTGAIDVRGRVQAPSHVTPAT